MNRRPSGSMTLSKAVVGFVNHKLAEGLTERSINSYERTLKKWIQYEGDKDISEVEFERNPKISGLVADRIPASEIQW